MWSLPIENVLLLDSNISGIGKRVTIEKRLISKIKK